MSQITHCLRLRFTAEQYAILTQHDNRLLEAILAVAKPESYKMKELKTESSDDDDTPIFPEPEPTCPICIDTISNTFTTPCGHNFCGSCMDSLFASSSVQHAMIACPVCRQDVPNPLYEAPQLPIQRSPDEVRVGGVIAPEYRNTTLMRTNTFDQCKERIRFLLRPTNVWFLGRLSDMNCGEILDGMKRRLTNDCNSHYYHGGFISSNKFDGIKRHILGYNRHGVSQMVLLELLLVAWYSPNFKETGLRNFRNLIKGNHPDIWAYDWVLSAPSDLSPRYFQDRDYTITSRGVAIRGSPW